MGRHFHIINFSLTKQLVETYISVFLKNFAISMIAIFLPIYLFKELSYSFREILLFFILLQMIASLSSTFVAKLNARLGCKHTILISVPFTLLFYIFLDILKDYSFIFWVIPVVGGISQSLYWIAFHVNFAKYTDKKHRGEEVSFWYVTTIVLGVIGPLIGALILTFLTFNILFVLVAILLLASAIPLLSTKEVFSTASFSVKSIFSIKRLVDGLAFMGYGARQIAGALLWPFFIFFIIREYFSLGLIISLSSVFTALMSWIFIGKKIDRHSKRKFINLGIVLDSIVNFLRIFPNGFLSIFGLTIAGNVSYDLVDIPLSAKTYDKAQYDTLGYITYRSVFINFGRALLLFVPFIASYYVDPLVPYAALKYGFIAVIPFIFLQRLILVKKY